MGLQVLLNCMNDEYMGLIEKSNLEQVSTIIVDQTDKEEISQLSPSHTLIKTTTRGISIGRNMCLDKASGDICLFCDNDEYLADDLEEIILKAYESLPKADLILFNFEDGAIRYDNRKSHPLPYINALAIASRQISFKLDSIQKADIHFDTNLGAPSTLPGEDSKFIIDCMKAGLKVYYCPSVIGKLRSDAPPSNWFSGYTKDYFFSKGRCVRYMIGLPLAIMASFYYCATRFSLYRKEISPITALFSMIKGTFQKIK